MTYEFECPKGHLSEVVRPVGGTLPKTVKCPCGRRARRLVSLPVLMATNLGKHRTPDSSERAYGAGHNEALRIQREHAEWETAIGVADGHKGDGKSAWALPTAEGVREKQEQIKAGAKPPESVTYGLRQEVVDALGR